MPYILLGPHGASNPTKDYVVVDSGQWMAFRRYGEPFRVYVRSRVFGAAQTQADKMNSILMEHQ